MENRKVLLISNSRDLHIDIIEQHFRKQNQGYFRLNLDHFPKDYDINFAKQSGMGSSYRLSHLPSGASINNHEVKSVWLRKKGQHSFLSDDLEAQEQKFAELEVKHLLHGFMHSLDCYWISHPRALRACQWKLAQITKASNLGFTVPDSLITNNPQELARFFERHNQQIITKPLSDGSLAASEVEREEIVTTGMMTTMVTTEHMEHLDAVKEIPCFFQRYVEKAYEVRATVVGDKIFAARIDSQADERTKVDFRDYSAEIDYDFHQLPDDIAAKAVELVHSYGLEYGALDFVVTPQNDYVFLEINSGGQFWFIQQLVPDLKIMEHLALCLMKASR